MSARTRHGFTLIELIVSAAILAIISVYLADLFTRQSRAYSVVDNVTEIQSNLRAIGHLVERELRTTGMLVPEAGALCGVDNTNTADVLYVTDSEALSPGAVNNLGANITSGYSGSGSDTINLDDIVLDGDPFYDRDADGVLDSDFQQGAGVIVLDPTNAAKGASCGFITAVNASSLDVTWESGAIAGPGLVAIPAHVYKVVGTQLLRDGLVLADDVEDLQWAAFYDLNDNDLMDGENLEYIGSATGPQYASNGRDNSELREVRISWVARTRLPDQDMSVGVFQATENRVAPGGTDGFRRRVYTTRVRPRNVGQRQGT
jgi:prepilin-type N-terminal cleavage/methylation domain-containing protein